MVSSSMIQVASSSSEHGRLREYGAFSRNVALVEVAARMRSHTML